MRLDIRSQSGFRSVEGFAGVEGWVFTPSFIALKPWGVVNLSPLFVLPVRLGVNVAGRSDGLCIRFL